MIDTVLLILQSLTSCGIASYRIMDIVRVSVTFVSACAVQEPRGSHYWI